MPNKKNKKLAKPVKKASSKVSKVAPKKQVKVLAKKAVKKVVPKKVVKDVKKVAANKKAVSKPVKKVTAKIKKPLKKVAIKTPKKVVKKIVSKAIKKTTKKAEVKNKKVQKIITKISKIKSTKKVELKSKKPTKIAPPKINKKIKSEKKLVAKKISKKLLKENQLKELNVQTSAKIIAKAKKNIHETKNKIAEPKPVEVAEKKNDSQKNAIIVKKLLDSRHKITFKVNDYSVYPSHGVGKIIDIEKTSVLGQDLSCYLMHFEKEKLIIKIPVSSAEKIGLRHLVSKSQMDEVFSTLRSGIKKLKGMWSRRAQEYETKINSGDIMLLAEVLRDLTRDIEDGERSYSERIIYETAVHRLAAEYSVIYGSDFEEAKEKIISTAKDKLGIEGKITQKDEFDEFDYDAEEADAEEDEEEEEEEDEDDDYGDDDDDDKPKKRKKKK